MGTKKLLCPDCKYPKAECICTDKCDFCGYPEKECTCGFDHYERDPLGNVPVTNELYQREVENDYGDHEYKEA